MARTIFTWVCLKCGAEKSGDYHLGRPNGWVIAYEAVDSKSNTFYICNNCWSKFWGGKVGKKK